MPRNDEDAHELVRNCAMRSFETEEEFSSVLMRAGVGKYLKEKELLDLMKPEKYTGLASKKATEIVRKLHAKP